MQQDDSENPPVCPELPCAEAGRRPRLPTLQRNALCKLFNRHEFTPADVYALGYRRLQKAEGVGHKGLLAIIEWLAFYGYELTPPALPADPPAEVSPEVQRSINGAVRLLRQHGYRVQRTRES